MPAISNKDLLAKCKNFIQDDPTLTRLDYLIKDAIITASREIADLGHEPVAWNREQYDEIFTRYYAQISDITTADPAVITAESVDPDLSSDHGFQTNDIVYLEGINGDNQNHRLNQRLFRAVRVSAATLTLKALGSAAAISSASYEDYDTGGVIYHAGIILPSTIEPTGGTASYEWDIKRVFGVKVDGNKCDPISEDQAVAMGINKPGGTPRRWRYNQYSYASFTSDEHVLMWYPYPSQRYNINAMIEKIYPDPSVWTSSVYPPHPEHIHNFIWQRALANLASHGERQRRRSAGKEGETGDNTKIEILNAKYWIGKAAADEIRILDYSSKLMGNQAYISEGMSA
jgi:hypothetical protein